MNGIMGIGMRSLLANQSALMITSQNMANVNTPYYCRRQIEFADAVFNNGVTISDVQRVFSDAASQNLQEKASAHAMTDIYFQNISDFELLLDDKTSNIGLYIDDSVTALRTLNGAPNLTNRNVYINKLNTMINQFQTVSGKISAEKDNVNLSLQSTAASVNLLTVGIAQLNQQLLTIPVNERSELLDQRETLKQELAKYCDFNALVDSSGQLNIYIGNGTLLVNGPQASQLQTQTNATNPDTLDLVVDTGTESLLVTSAINGGQLGGLLAYYNNALTEAERGLGRLALGIADAFNTQNKLGMDLNRNLGGNIFTDINNPTFMADRIVPNLNNTGNPVMTVAINNTSQLTTSDYQLQFDASQNYVLTRLSDNSIMSTGSAASLPATISADGFQININSGTIVGGDKYTISPTRGAASGLEMEIIDGALLGLALPIDTVTNTSPSSDGKITSISVNDTTNAAFSLSQQLNPPISIKFLSPTTYQIINANDNSIIEAGPITYTSGANIFPTPGGMNPGYQIAISGQALKTDDLFTVNYNTQGTSDVRNGQIMSTLYDKGTLANGTLTFRQAYDTTALDISAKTNAARIGNDASQASFNIAEKRFYEVSGVSIEEESLNLTKFQQSYTASAQILEIAKTLFDVILGLARR